MGMEIVGGTFLHFRIAERLGDGRIGVVYRAEDIRLKRPVVLKVWSRELIPDTKALERFARTARRALALNHPNICVLYDVGEWEGLPYVAMEYVDGQSLDNRISAKPLKIDEFLALSIEIADALCAAHRIGIVHGAMKPANIRLTSLGHGKLMEVGFDTAAKMALFDPDYIPAADVSRRGMPIPQHMEYYASPEQVRGEDLDPRSDVFSFGAVLYEMATGIVPFGGDSRASIFTSIMHKNCVPPTQLRPDLPPEFDRIIANALERDLETRYQSAQELCASLKRIKRDVESRRHTASHASRVSAKSPNDDEGVEIAQVLFMDLVEFSKLATDEQKSLLKTLNDIVRRLPQFQRSEESDQLIALPTGDGMVLVFFTDPTAPVRCACEIARAVRDHPRIRLRMGIHSGPVFRVRDIKNQKNVTGAGINIAQRVMDCGTAGHILVSSTVAEVLSHLTDWLGCLHDLGEYEVKHGARIHLYNLYTGEAGNPHTPTGREPQSSRQEPKAEITGGRSRIPMFQLPRWVSAGVAVSVVAGLAIYAAFLRSGFIHSTSRDQVEERLVPLEPVLQRITADSGLSAYPAISADGKVVAYASDRSGLGSLDIWSQLIGSGGPVRRTNDPTDEYDVTVSPDGARLAYRSEKDGGGVYVINTFSGEAQLLAKHGRNPRFSPDGKRIAYWVGSDGSGFLEGSARLFIVSAGGGHPQAVRADFAAAMAPLWSPAGDGLLFVGRRDAKKSFDSELDWWVTPLQGGEPVRTGALMSLRKQELKFPAGQSMFVPLIWQRNEQVVVSALRGDGTNLWSVPLDRSTHRVGTARRITSGTGFELHAGASISGDRIVYSSLLLNMDLWSLSTQGDTGKPVAPGLQRLTSGPSTESHPSVTRDGSLVAYVREQFGVHSIQIKDLRTGEERTVLSLGSRWLEPKISGDGRWIAYDDEQFRIFRMPAGGGEAVNLCEACGPPTSMSHDGRRVLFEPIKPPYGVMELDSQSGLIKTLARPGAQDHLLYNAQMSPDGEWIAFHASFARSGNRQIFVARVKPGETDSSEWIPITDGRSSDRHACWSSRGKVIYFLSDRDEFWCVWARALDSRTMQPVGGPFPVHHFHNARLSLRRVVNFGNMLGLTAAPDRLVFAAGELTGNIWLSDRSR